MIGAMAPKDRRTARVAPEGSFIACSSSTLAGDLRTSAPGAYLSAVSASGTCANRRAARAARRPDLMDKPSLQTSQAIRSGVTLDDIPEFLRRAEGRPRASRARPLLKHVLVLRPSRQLGVDGR